MIAVGTRLQDFTTSSWTGFAADTRLVTINVAAFDAVKHAAHAVVGDAHESLLDLGDELAGWRAGADWTARATTERRRWDAHVDTLRAGTAPDGSLTYAQVVGVVNELSGPEDYVLGSSGGIPGELHGGWRAGAVASGPDAGATMDLEYGFSCMGYEIAGPWGAALARAGSHPDGIVTSLFGDGSYVMANSELYSAAFAGHPWVGVLCDNGGYAVIHRLQTGQGAPGFNNLLADCAGDSAVRVDFAAHAAALGALVYDVPAGAGVAELRTAYGRARDDARAARRPAIVLCRTHPASWTESGAWWEVGAPDQLSGRPAYDPRTPRQLRWTTG